MITGYGIILEDDILYCSNENTYNSFEIVLFVEKLISSINPNRTWRLSNIYLKGFRMGKERMIIKHIFTENNQNLFYCINGDFSATSEVAYKMLEEFYDKITNYYKTTDLLVQASKKPIFTEIIETATDYLWDKYEPLLETELNNESNGTNGNSKILYCGISVQGLPIISKLFDKNMLKFLNKEITDENVELYNSNLSGKLATIAMNTVIRAKTSIREIHIDDMDDKLNKKIILYDEINKYSLDFFAMGDFRRIKNSFNKLKDKIANEKILSEEFSGDLKPYRYLQSYLDEIVKEFD